MLTGFTTEAIRQAAAQGRIRTRAVVYLSGRPTRLLDLQSVIDNWDLDADKIRDDINDDHSVTIATSLTYRPYTLVSPGMFRLLYEEHPQAEQWHKDTGLWPVWFKEQR